MEYSFFSLYKKVFKKLYIDESEIKDNICIDARTQEEFFIMNYFENNIPIINKEAHYFVRRYKVISPLIILLSIIKNNEYIKKELFRLSNNKENILIFACSKGRLRSPSLCIYSRLLGIESYVLEGGIRHHFSEDIQSMYFADIRNCIVDEKLIDDNKKEQCEY